MAIYVDVELLRTKMFIMKKLFLFSILCLFFYSCDKGYYIEEFVVNHCDDTIHIKMMFPMSEIEFDVAPDSEYMYDSESVGYGYPARFKKGFYRAIIVTKNGMSSNVNYIVPERWYYVECEKYKFKSFLYINPEDFEE
jgi:hypothetical protein